MVCPSVFTVAPKFPEAPIRVRECPGSGHAPFSVFRLQVDERMRRRADLAGKPFDDFDAAVAERAHLARVIGQEPNAWNAKVVEDCGRQAEVPEVGLEPERMIGLDRVDSRVLQLVSL